MSELGEDAVFAAGVITTVTVAAALLAKGICWLERRGHA